MRKTVLWLPVNVFVTLAMFVVMINGLAFTVAWLGGGRMCGP